MSQESQTSDAIDDLLFQESGTHYRHLSSSIERTITLEYSLLLAVLAFTSAVISPEKSQLAQLDLLIASLFLVTATFGLFCYTKVVGEQGAMSAHGSLIRLKYLNKVSPDDDDENILVFFDKKNIVPRSPLFWLFRIMRRSTSSDGARLIASLPPIVSGAIPFAILFGAPWNIGAFQDSQNKLSASTILNITLSSLGLLISALLFLDLFFKQAVHKTSHSAKDRKSG